MGLSWQVEMVSNVDAILYMPYMLVTIQNKFWSPQFILVILQSVTVQRQNWDSIPVSMLTETLNVHF